LRRDPLYWLDTNGKMRRNKWATELGDRLAPLWNWLESNIGRPWDKVYSEFCAVTDRRNIRGYHLWDHLGGYVDWGQQARVSNRSYANFVVDEQGILREGYR